jgi:uncharacterized membrane protein
VLTPIPEADLVKKQAEPSPAAPVLNLDRLLFLTDGVFAITLTLLVLDLRLPPGSTDNLGPALLGLAPKLAAYFFAFITIANQWILHHRSFQFVQAADNRLVLYSFVYLLFVTLIPATAAILGDAPSNPLAAGCFSVNILFLCLMAWVLWDQLSRAGQLLTTHADPAMLRKLAHVWRYVCRGFVIAIAAGFVSVYISYGIWLLWPFTARWIR